MHPMSDRMTYDVADLDKFVSDNINGDEVVIPSLLRA